MNSSEPLRLEKMATTKTPIQSKHQNNQKASKALEIPMEKA